MWPYKKAVVLAHLVHEEFEKHADVLIGAMPELEKLVVKKGHFALRTAHFFPPVLSLEIGASLSPDHLDMLSPEHLNSLRHVAFNRIPIENEKSWHIINAVSTGSPNLQSVTINMQCILPIRTLDTLFTTKPNLRTLKLSNLATEILGLLFFNSLPQMANLKTLELSFMKLRDQDINGNADKCRFMPSSCPSV